MRHGGRADNEYPACTRGRSRRRTLPSGVVRFCAHPNRIARDDRVPGAESYWVTFPRRDWRASRPREREFLSHGLAERRDLDRLTPNRRPPEVGRGKVTLLASAALLAGRVVLGGTVRHASDLAAAFAFSTLSSHPVRQHDGVLVSRHSVAMMASNSGFGLRAFRTAPDRVAKIDGRSLVSLHYHSKILVLCWHNASEWACRLRASPPFQTPPASACN